MTLRTIADAIKPAAQAAALASTSVGLAGVALPSGAAKLKLTNLGPNKAYVSISSQAAALAVLPGAAFAGACIPVGVNEAGCVIDLTHISSGPLYLSTICALTETAAIVATTW